MRALSWAENHVDRCCNSIGGHSHGHSHAHTEETEALTKKSEKKDPAKKPKATKQKAGGDSAQADVQQEGESGFHSFPCDFVRKYK